MSQAPPLGALGRPLMKSKVFSSGAIMPARAPPSIDMLQTVMRPSIDSARMASPAYSMTWPVPPAVPISPMMARMMSLAVTPAGSSPSTLTRMFLALLLDQRLRGEHVLDLADVPMPCASAPKAPCVEVWLSPQTIVVPGSVKPCSGPTTWTMPWRLSSSSKYSTPKSRGVLGQRLDLDAALVVVDALGCGRSSARCGRRRPASSPARAPCGPTCAGPRTPAGSSPRGRGGGRCRAGTCRRPGARRRDRRRSCRRVSWPCRVSSQMGREIAAGAASANPPAQRLGPPGCEGGSGCFLAADAQETVPVK